MAHTLTIVEPIWPMLQNESKTMIIISHRIETKLIIINSQNIAMETYKQGFLCTCIVQFTLSDAVCVYIIVTMVIELIVVHMYYSKL